MKFSGFIFVFFCLFIFGSCDLINPAERLPVYVHIDSFRFVPAANTGTSSHKITSAWVYFDNQAIGVFDLPATVPILTDKAGTLLVSPGITYSGLSDLQAKYPFYQSDTVTIQPSSGQVINFIPETKYYADSIFSITNEDFELGNSFSVIPGSDTDLTRVSDPGLVFEGSYAGYIYLKNQVLSENIMNVSFTPGSTSEVFAELNYKCSLPFEVGVQSTTSTGQLFTQYLFGFHPKTEWNKVYIGLQDFIILYPNKTYRIVIRVKSDTPVEGSVSIDNLKLIYIRK